MFSDPVTFTLLLLILAILCLILWIFLFRKPFAPILMILTAFLLYVILDQESISFEIANYNINLLDILSIFILSLAIFRLFFIKTKQKRHLILIILLGILLFLSWLRGTFQFDIETSTNALRSYLYFYAILLYTVTLTYSNNLFHKLKLLFIITGVVLILLAIIRWIMVSAGLISSIYWAAPNGELTRVLSAPGTFMLLQLLFVVIYSNRSRNYLPFVMISAAILILMIILLQQRTVWIALIVSTLLALIIKSRVRGIVFLAFLLVIVLGFFFAAWNNISIEDLTGTPLDLRNLNWRIQGWQTLIDPSRYQSVIDYMIGQPFGTGFARYILESIYETRVSPHNFYLQTFLNIGGIGLLVLLLIYGTIIRSLWNHRAERVSQLFLILLVAQLVFFMTYAPNFEQGIILGFALLFVQFLRVKNSLQPDNELLDPQKRVQV